RQAAREGLAELRLGRRAQRHDLAAVRKADEALAHVHELRQRAQVDHGLQRLVDVVRLRLRVGQQAQQGLAPWCAHGLAGLVLVLPTAAAAVVLAAVDLAALGPAREQARSATLEQQHARAPRRLPALLRADDDRAAVVERRQEPARVHLRL